MYIKARNEHRAPTGNTVFPFLIEKSYGNFFQSSQVPINMFQFKTYNPKSHAFKNAERDITASEVFKNASKVRNTRFRSDTKVLETKQKANSKPHIWQFSEFTN